MNISGYTLSSSMASGPICLPFCRPSVFMERCVFDDSSHIEHLESRCTDISLWPGQKYWVEHFIWGDVDASAACYEGWMFGHYQALLATRLHSIDRSSLPNPQVTFLSDEDPFNEESLTHCSDFPTRSLPRWCIYLSCKSLNCSYQIWLFSSLKGKS